MANRNVDKGREAENATARVLQAAGCPHAERRAKRGGMVRLASGDVVPADAGDITGVPGVVVQVKWSPYRPLHHDLARTEEQRQVIGADVGLLVRKRHRVGLERAAEWDAYLPMGQLAYLLDAQAPMPELAGRVWHTDLWTAARTIALGGYGIGSFAGHVEAPSPSPV